MTTGVVCVSCVSFTIFLFLKSRHNGSTSFGFAPFGLSSGSKTGRVAQDESLTINRVIITSSINAGLISLTTRVVAILLSAGGKEAVRCQNKSTYTSCERRVRLARILGLETSHETPARTGKFTG